MEQIGVCRLTASDVVRHPLVTAIIEAYDQHDIDTGNVGHRALDGARPSGRENR
ncbi:MAG: hypothetical protein R3F59_25935 [Myxococcota bacterium]